MENKHKQFSDKHYIFFVRRTTPANPTTGEINNYENYLLDKTDRRNCWLTDWDASTIDKFRPSVYPYIECVYAPVNGKYSLEQMNEKLIPEGKQLTAEEKLAKELKEQSTELAKMKAKLEAIEQSEFENSQSDAKFVETEPKKAYTRKPTK